MRLSERRRDDVAGDLPALGALLRRLRVALLGLRTDEDRERAVRLAHAAATQADKQGKTACADTVRAAGRIIAGKDLRQVPEADSLIIQAMDQASS